MSIQLSGIDVSTYQGSIAWSSAAADGIEFAIIRAGYGRSLSQEDGYFKTNYTGTAAIELPTGAYWYSYATSASQAEAEADTCLQVISGKEFIYPVFIDIEEISSGLAKTEYTNIAIAFCNKIAAAGYKAGVYANKYTLTNYIDVSQLGNRYIWLANYTTTTDYPGRYDIHQFSNTGSVSGISGNVDLNRCYTDFTDSSPSEPSEPTEPTPSLTAGSKITLNNTALFASATASGRAATKSGTYYVYDGVAQNNRIRITNSSNNAGKTPMSDYVTGWINKSDI